MVSTFVNLLAMMVILENQNLMEELGKKNVNSNEKMFIYKL